MTREEMASQLEQEVKGLTSYLDPADYYNACDDASRETGFSFPVSTDFQILWTKDRAKRHLFFYLLTESAHKFKYEQINLQHRFDHYLKIIDTMDEKWEAAKEENALELSGASSVNMFGTKFDAGFQYSSTGKDTTYNRKNQVVLTPTEND